MRYSGRPREVSDSCMSIHLVTASKGPFPLPTGSDEEVMHGIHHVSASASGAEANDKLPN
jgi:hypothetical protein